MRFYNAEREDEQRMHALHQEYEEQVAQREAKWDMRFLGMAQFVSQWSKDPSTKVGAVIVRPDKTVASVGFNGFPRGIRDTEERLSDRDLKYKLILHAEVNAIHNAKEPLTGYTLYTWPPGYGPTCENCAIHVIQSGIKRVVGCLPTDPDFASRWKESCEKATALYQEADVAVWMYPQYERA